MAIMEHIRKQLEQMLANDRSSSSCALLEEMPCDAERAAFRRMLMQNPQETARLYRSPKKAEGVFDGQLQQAYALGLAKTYSLETVDPRSIRKLQAEAKESPKKALPSFEEGSGEDLQLTFDFGPCFRRWTKALVYLQPIAMLRLCTQAEKKLVSEGLHTIGDLLDADLSALELPQGHLDEVKQRLGIELENQPIRRCFFIDLEALVQLIAGQGDLCKNYLLLEAYGLHKLLYLPKAMLAEVKRTTKERRRCLCEDAKRSALAPQAFSFYSDAMQELLTVFVSSWLAQRGGIGRRFEVMERLEKICRTPQLLEPFLAFAKEVYHGKSCPLRAFLPSPEPAVFCSDAATAQKYEKVISCALSYFPNPSAVYDMPHLCTLLFHAFACSWQNIDPSFICQALRSSQAFCVRKDHCGRRLVRLSYPQIHI